MQFWALIVDSFRESLDRKIFWVLAGLSLLVAATMFCVNFEPTKVNIMFGLWEFETDMYDPTTDFGRGNIANIAVECMDTVVGWIGVMLAIIATASFFPAFMRRGAIDALLSKPMSRGKVFLGKYMGSMVFVLLQAGFFGLSTFAVMGVRWGTWLPKYLLMIPLLVILFSYLYCVSVWAAVTMRSTVAAIFLSMGAWVVFTGIQSVDDVFELYPEWQEKRAIFYTARTLRWVVPKTQDITYLAKRWSGASSDANLVPPSQDEDFGLGDRFRALEDKRRNVSALHTIGSSLAFEALIVLLAMWAFARKDY